MNMNFSIEEVHDLTKKAHNAAIEVAANILDAKCEYLKPKIGLSMNIIQSSEYTALLILCERLAVEIRNLRRE